MSNSQTPPQATTALSTATTAPVYMTTPPIPIDVQGGSMLGFPKGWNPATGYGMPPDFFTPQSAAQFDASATQPMASQSNTSSTQLMTPQQGASVTQPIAQNT